MTIPQRLPLPGRNRAKNPSTEVNLTDIASLGSAAVTRVTDRAWVGGYATKVAATLTAGSGVRYVVDISDLVPVSSTEHLIQARVRLWASSGAIVPVVSLNVVYTDATSTISANAHLDLAGNNDWQAVTTEAVLTDPAKTLSACYVYITNYAPAPIAFTAYVDGLDVRADEEPEALDTYLDGSMPGGKWTGTAHDSASTRTASDLLVVYPNINIGKGGAFQTTVRVFIANQQNEIQSEISPYVDRGKVAANEEARGGKRTFDLDTWRPDLITSYADFFAPYMKVEYADGRVVDDGSGYGWQMGLYAIVPPKKSITPAEHNGSYDGRDLTWLLADMAYDRTQNEFVGANVTDNVISRLAAKGFTRVLIPRSSRVLGRARTWKPGTPVLTVLNDLLATIGYYNLWMDSTGRLVSRRYVDLLHQEPAAIYYGGNDGSIIDPVGVNPEVQGVINHLVVTKDDPKHFLRAVRRNTNPASASNLNPPPVGIGLHSRTVNNPDAHDQEDLDAYADRLAQEWGSIYVGTDFQTYPEPWHDLHEVYEAHLTDQYGDKIEEVDGLFRCKGWQLGLAPGDGPMQHDIYRLVQFTADL